MARVFLGKFPRLKSKDTYLITIKKHILDGEMNMKKNDKLVSYWDTEEKHVHLLKESDYRELITDE